MQPTKSKNHPNFSDNEVTRADRAFLEKMIRCELTPAEFSHEAHLRLAWINITLLGPEKAETVLRDQLQNFVTHLGAQDKYHATLTIAAVKLMAHYMANASARNFSDFLLEFPALKSSFREIIGQHYSYNIFRSEEARRQFLEPNLLQFVLSPLPDRRL